MWRISRAKYRESYFPFPNIYTSLYSDSNPVPEVIFKPQLAGLCEIKCDSTDHAFLALLEILSEIVTWGACFCNNLTLL